MERISKSAAGTRKSDAVGFFRIRFEQDGPLRAMCDKVASVMSHAASVIQILAVNGAFRVPLGLLRPRGA